MMAEVPFAGQFGDGHRGSEVVVALITTADQNTHHMHWIRHTWETNALTLSLKKWFSLFGWQ
jgi:hypothetical protein